MQPSMQFLRAASIVNYEFIPEERKYLKFENRCAEDNILSIYCPLIKKLNQQNFRDLARNYFDTEDYEWKPERKKYKFMDIKHCSNSRKNKYLFRIL